MQGNFGARIWTGKNIWTFMCVCIARYTLYIYICNTTAAWHTARSYIRRTKNKSRRGDRMTPPVFISFLRFYIILQAEVVVFYCYGPGGCRFLCSRV